MMPIEAVSLGFDPGDSVIITGAGSGIGAATARHAAAVGLAVIAWDLDGDAVARTVAEIDDRGGTAVAITADVTDATAVAAALEQSSALGPVRYLVNNAGPGSGSELEFDQALSMCIGSMRTVTNAWLTGGVPAGAALVNLASIAGNVIGTAPDWYSASKAGIAGYTRHLATYRHDVVRSNAVAPGLTDTPRMAAFKESELGHRILERIPSRRMAQPDEIAWAILFLLSPLASYVNGVVLVVDGGWTITQ